MLERAPSEPEVGVFERRAVRCQPLEGYACAGDEVDDPSGGEAFGR